MVKNYCVETKCFLFKIFYSVFLKFLLPEKVLQFNTGWDILHPCSPYSYGGLPRKKFLILFRKFKSGEKIISDEYHRALYGTLQPTMLEVSKKITTSEVIKKRFSWKKTR